MPKVWKPLLAIGILQYVSLWNSYYQPLLYLNSQDRFPPVTRLFTLANGNPESGLNPGDPAFMLYAAFVCLLPVVLLLVFRKLLTSEALLSQIRQL